MQPSGIRHHVPLSQTSPCATSALGVEGVAAMLASIPTASLMGSQGRLTTVEVHVGQGLPGFSIVGLPDEACRESRDRVRAAIVSSDLTWPNKRITVNLAPSGIRKSGAGLDLPLAIGVCVAAELVPLASVDGLAFVGELGLDGGIRTVPGIAPLAAALQGYGVVVAASAVAEARVGNDLPVRTAATLRELVEVLNGRASWPDPPHDLVVGEPLRIADLADVRGQAFARQALEIAAAGHHHMLMVGPPGAGKTMLAERLSSILPDLDDLTAIDVTMVHSACGLLPMGGLVRHPPFRAPHHSSSLVAMVGGGTATLRPGELSLAHGGVLFLDELGEYPASVLDALRQPLEDREVRISRARASAVLPADVLLIAATNPCPCGGGRPGDCSCGESARARYLRRLSGPLLDRFDVRLVVARPNVDAMLDSRPSEGSCEVRKRVEAARRIADDRAGMPNGRIPPGLLDELAPISVEAHQMLRKELEHGRLTGRGLHRVRRVARTIADLQGNEGCVGADEMRIALQLRVDPRGDQW